MTTDETGSARSSRLFGVIIGLCLAMLAASALVWWPGIAGWDAEDKYGQILAGDYNDGQPPVMARLWSLLLVFGKGPAALFLLHNILYWAAVALIAVALAHREKPRAALAAVAVAALPPFLAFNAHLYSDVGLAVSCLAAFALTFHFGARHSRMPLPFLAVVLVLLAYACLVRDNGVFAAAPLIVYAVAPYSRASLPKLLLLMGAMVAVCIPMSSVANRHLLGAEPANAVGPLRSYDMVGISRFSGDLRPFAYNRAITPALLDACYDPVRWDQIGKGVCRALWRDLGYRAWVGHILAHPLAYARHRALHMNAELFVLTPRQKPERLYTTRYPELPRNAFERENRQVLKASTDGALFAPVITFVLALAVLALSSTPAARREGGLQAGVFYLSAASAIYTGSFALIGVASAYRYEQFPMLAAFLSPVLYICARPPENGALSWGEKAGLGAVVAAMLVVIAGRLAA